MSFLTDDKKEKLDGFVMRYEMNMRRGRRMEVEVTKIDLDKELSDKEFELPKDEWYPAQDLDSSSGFTNTNSGTTAKLWLTAFGEPVPAYRTTS